ncbi:uncharacterized protein LOC125233743 [Leguminivora glycinivorella]|uniref:uncharacterized protein LOC125233743 n=1 Tax=Leguminivora glycinivorella TaxID=1035111 RepID=UPI00200D2E9D|nr:uncharacterized protein LOC125233743 [Leguminivora glycinivorella]
MSTMRRETDAPEAERARTGAVARAGAAAVLVAVAYKIGSENWTSNANEYAGWNETCYKSVMKIRGDVADTSAGAQASGEAYRASLAATSQPSAVADFLAAAGSSGAETSVRVASASPAAIGACLSNRRRTDSGTVTRAGSVERQGQGRELNGLLLDNKNARIDWFPKLIWPEGTLRIDWFKEYLMVPSTSRIDWFEV